MAKDTQYPLGTKKETKNFSERKKIKKEVFALVKQIAKEETFKAFKQGGYKEKENGYFAYSKLNQKGEEKVGGKGVSSDSVNVTISTPKKYSDDADTAPVVSFFQKVITVNGKKNVAEIYVNINNDILEISYKNTEDAAFIQPHIGKLQKDITINDIKNTKKLKKQLSDFFKEIAESEVKYLTGTKIAQDDKIEKNQNASVTMENKYSLKTLLEGNFNEVANKIKKLQQLEKQKLEEISTTPGGIAGPFNGEVNPTNNSETSVGGAYATIAASPIKRKLGAKGQDGEIVADENNIPLDEKVKKTPYGQMKESKPYIVKEDGTYNVKVEFEPGEQNLNVPKGMKKNYALGMHGVDVNSKEELKRTGHGKLNKIHESFQEKVQRVHRSFALNEDNEKLGINKRYIITEKFNKKEEFQRFKQLLETTELEKLKEYEVPGDEVEDLSNKEFEKNQNPEKIESDLESTPYCGDDEEGYIITPKSNNSLIMFKLAEADVKQNKAYIKDYYTNKLVKNPLYK